MKIKTGMTEIEMDALDPADVITCKLDRPKADKIIWGFPDKLEMTDDAGVVHTYSIIEILDGLTQIARKNKNLASQKKKDLK